MSHLYFDGTTDAISTDRTARAHRWARVHIKSWNAGISTRIERGHEGEQRIQATFTRGSGSGPNGERYDLGHIELECDDTGAPTALYLSPAFLDLARDLGYELTACEKSEVTR